MSFKLVLGEIYVCICDISIKHFNNKQKAGQFVLKVFLSPGLNYSRLNPHCLSQLSSTTDALEIVENVADTVCNVG